MIYFNFIATVISLAFLGQAYAEIEAADKHLQPSKVLCFGPKGPRGHQGPIGERGLTGPVGPNGRNGDDPTNPSLNMIYLYSKAEFQEAEGYIPFTGYEMTQGFEINGDMDEIQVEVGGVYMFYYYIRDNYAYLDTEVNGTAEFYYEIEQYDGNQIWYQYPVYVPAGGIVKFYSYNEIPDVSPTNPPANYITYSISMQLLMPI